MEYKAVNIPADADEARVKKAVTHLLKSFGPDLWYYMPAANGFGRAGIPDYVGCLRGQFFAVETKAPKRRHNLSTGQVREGADIIKAGGMWMVVADNDDLESLRGQLAGLLANN